MRIAYATASHISLANTNMYMGQSYNSSARPCTLCAWNIVETCNN